MIAPDAALTAAWLPLNCIVVEQHEPRDLARVAFYLDLMQTSTAHAGPPIAVRPLDSARYAVLDGHHRYVAHILAGRERVPCVIVDEGRGMP